MPARLRVRKHHDISLRLTGQLWNHALRSVFSARYVRLHGGGPGRTCQGVPDIDADPTSLRSHRGRSGIFQGMTTWWNLTKIYGACILTVWNSNVQWKCTKIITVSKWKFDFFLYRKFTDPAPDSIQIGKGRPSPSSTPLVAFSHSTPPTVRSSHFLGRIACTTQMQSIATDVARSVVCLSVCLCVGHTHVPYENGWTDRDAVWVTDLCGPNEPRILGGVEIPHGKGQFWRVVRPTEKHWESLLRLYAAKWIIQSSITACSRMDHSSLDKAMTCDAAFCQNFLTTCYTWRRPSYRIKTRR